jgi:Leucine-rich repeat (LRR) protein
MSAGLKTIPASLFRDSRQLRKVDFRSNGIESLPDDLFVNSKNLNSLDLRENLLTDIKTILNRLDNTRNSY